MAYQVRVDKRPLVNQPENLVYVLEKAGGGTRAEICPALGCNCFRWQATVQGKSLELLYTSPDFFEGARPTRTGIPILFPFPNRIRDGRFSWEGKSYQLPLNDPSGKNAIHGFACRRPWRVVGQGANADAAWLTAEFHGAKDAPETAALWPADYRIQVTLRLTETQLRLEAVVDNPDQKPLPFGLGYHPYFHIPLVPGGPAEQCLAQVAAREYWELRDSLPSGERLPVDEPRDLRQPRRYSDLKLDDLLPADLGSVHVDEDALCQLGSVRQEPDQIELVVRASPSFHEIVLFTPPHRQAFCIEPYTCITDAINIGARRADAGVLVLEPGAKWRGIVELEVGQRP